MPTAPVPIFRMPRDARREHADRFVGDQCHVGIDLCRDGRVTTYTGLVVSVAVSSPSDLIVVKVPGKWDQAFSLAILRSIEPVVHG